MPVKRLRLRPWFVAQVQSRREAWAAVNVSNQQAEYYLPRLVTGEPLFPGYLFVRSPDGRWRFLEGTFGVIRVVRGDAGPAVLPAREIARLRAMEGTSGFVELPQHGYASNFQPGERVRVDDGPFIGFEGLCEGMTGRERVEVLLHLFGRETRVTLEPHQLERVKKR